MKLEDVIKTLTLARSRLLVTATAIAAVKCYEIQDVKPFGFAVLVSKCNAYVACNLHIVAAGR